MNIYVLIINMYKLRSNLKQIQKILSLVPRGLFRYFRSLIHQFPSMRLCNNELRNITQRNKLQNQTYL